MKLFKIGLTVAIFSLILSFAFFKKEAIACELISYSKFEEIQSEIYVDDSLNVMEREQLLKAIAEGEERVNTVYGKTISKPRYIATKKIKYGKFGMNLTGMQNSAFYRECIFLGPKGLNVDVAAHELVHAEVRYRTDFVTEMTKLPAWFIEGTGVKVDYRKPLLLENINLQRSEVEQIKSVFFLHNFPNTSVSSYQAARIAVEYIEPKSLYQGLERLNGGEDFETVFGKKN